MIFIGVASGAIGDFFQTGSKVSPTFASDHCPTLMHEGA